MRKLLAQAALFAVLLVPSAAVAWKFRAMPQLGATGDDQIYLVSAKSLAEGEGYRVPALPGNPHQTRFPVLYPALLSLVWRAAPEFPANLPWFVALNWLAVPLFLEASRRTFRWLGFASAEAWAMTALLAVHPGVVAAGITLGPDLLFSAALLALVLWHARTAGRGGLSSAALGVLGGGIYLLRTAAAPLLVAVPLWHARRREFARAAGFAAGLLPFALAWSGWARTHAAAASDPTAIFYTDYFRDFVINFSWANVPVVVVKNAEWFLEYAGTLAACVPFSPWTWACGGAAVAGACALARRTGVTTYHLFAAVYTAMLIAWTGKPLLRYLLPLAPLLVAGLVYGVRTISERIPWQKARRAPLAVVLGLVAWTLAVGLGAQTAAWSGQQHDAAAEWKAYTWMRMNLPRDAVVVANKEGVLHLATGLRATTYQVLKRDWYAEDRVALRAWVEALPQFARTRGAAFVFCDAQGCPAALPGKDAMRARRVLARSGDEVYRDGAVTVYKLRQ